MGGYGSGGGRYAPKTNELLDVDLAGLKRLGIDRPGYSGSLSWSQRGSEIARIGIHMFQSKCHLNYRARNRGDADWVPIKEDVHFDWTTTGLGGKRKWFLCPRCGGRCRVLYGGMYFRCRTCVGAVYESQYDPFFHACHERVRRLKLKLGVQDGDTFGIIPSRPKGMHHKTYNRIRKEIISEMMGLDDAIHAYAAKRGCII